MKKLLNFKLRNLYFSRNGFTFAEMLVVVGIITLIAVVTFLNLSGRRGVTDLNNSKKQIGALLREAQSRSVSRDDDMRWGVHFENSTGTSPFYALFSGVYSSTNTISYYRLPSMVGYITSTLAIGSHKEIVFEKLSGITTSTSIAVYLISNPISSTTISIASSGALSY
jgi:prepilin-type N-terminal cleavage/methylation domain-containing protein